MDIHSLYDGSNSYDISSADTSINHVLISFPDFYPSSTAHKTALEFWENAKWLYIEKHVIEQYECLIPPSSMRRDLLRDHKTEMSKISKSEKTRVSICHQGLGLGYERGPQPPVYAFEINAISPRTKISFYRAWMHNEHAELHNCEGQRCRESEHLTSLRKQYVNTNDDTTFATENCKRSLSSSLPALEVCLPIFEPVYVPCYMYLSTIADSGGESQNVPKMRTTPSEESAHDKLHKFSSTTPSLRDSSLRTKTNILVPELVQPRKKVPAASQLHPRLPGISALINCRATSLEALALLENSSSGLVKSETYRQSSNETAHQSSPDASNQAHQIPLTPISPSFATQLESPSSATFQETSDIGAIPAEVISTSSSVTEDEKRSVVSQIPAVTPQPPTSSPSTPPLSTGIFYPRFPAGVPLCSVAPPNAVPIMLLYDPVNMGYIRMSAPPSGLAQSHEMHLQQANRPPNVTSTVSPSAYQPVPHFYSPPLQFQCSRTESTSTEHGACLKSTDTTMRHHRDKTLRHESASSLHSGHMRVSTSQNECDCNTCSNDATSVSGRKVQVPQSFHTKSSRPRCRKVNKSNKLPVYRKNKTSASDQREQKSHSKKPSGATTQEYESLTSDLRENLLSRPPHHWENTRSKSDQIDINKGRIQELMDLYVSSTGNKLLGLHAVFELAKWYWSIQLHESKVASRWVLRKELSDDKKCTHTCGGLDIDPQSDLYVEHRFSYHFPSIQPIQCLFCEKRFATRRLSREHFRITHSVWEVSSWSRFMCRTSEARGGVISGCNSADITTSSRTLLMSHEIEIRFNSLEFSSEVFQKVTYDSELAQSIHAYRKTGNEKLGLYHVQRFMKRYWDYQNICYESSKAWSDKMYAEWEGSDNGSYCFDCEKHFGCARSRIAHRLHVHKGVVNCGMCLFCDSTPDTYPLLWEHLYQHHCREEIVQLSRKFLGDDASSVTNVIFNGSMNPKSNSTGLSQ